MDFAPGFAPQAPADTTTPAGLVSSTRSPSSNLQAPSAPLPQPAPGITAQCDIRATPCDADATESDPSATESNLDATAPTPQSSPSDLALTVCKCTANEADDSLDTPAACDQNHQIASHTALFNLSPVQERAIDLLIAGQPVMHIARDLNIHRATLSRWKTRHPRFIAELTRRSSLAQFDASLAARQALNIAMKTVLAQLRLKSKDNLELATRLLNSPRLARLAESSTPVPMRQVFADLHQSRNITPLPADPSDPALVDHLAAQLAQELQAPIPADPPKPFAKPKPVKQTNWEQTVRENQARRPPRKDMQDTLAMYRQPGEYLDPTHCDVIVRRPDLSPIDIHYYMWHYDKFHKKQKNALSCWLRSFTQVPPAGVQTPLIPWILVKLIQDGHIKRLAGHDLANCQPSDAGYEDTEVLILSFPAPNPLTLTIPVNCLWRDALTRPDLPIPGAI